MVSCNTEKHCKRTAERREINFFATERMWIHSSTHLQFLLLEKLMTNVFHLKNPPWHSAAFWVDAENHKYEEQSDLVVQSGFNGSGM